MLANGHAHVCVTAIILSCLVCNNAGLSINHGSLDTTLQDNETRIASSEDDRVFVVVLGHGQEERSPQLSATLDKFYQQLGPENFDCLVFVWNANMRLPRVPPGCEIKVTPGVFMEFTTLIPEERLQASRYAFIMADDVTLNVESKHSHTPPMDIAALRDLAAENCLDAVTPSFAGGQINYEHLKPNKKAGVGRLVQFFEFQGVLVTPNVIHLLARIASAKISGCWGYDSLLYTAVQKWTGRTPRLGIADGMCIDVGTKGLSSHNPLTNDHKCGTAEPDKFGDDHHNVVKNQLSHFRKEGLVDFHKDHDFAVGNLQEPSSHTKTKKACASLQAPGELALLQDVSKFDAWLESLMVDDVESLIVDDA